MNRQFAALRGVAMIIVLLHHAIDLGELGTSTAGYHPVQPPFAYLVTFFYELGIYAVPLFLFISGAFMAFAARGKPPALKWKMIRNNLTRVIWPYVIWSIIFYILVFFHYDNRFSPLGYIKNLIVGYPFNFIPLLIFYYILSPFLVRISRRFGPALLIGIGLYQILLVALNSPNIFGVDLPAWMRIFVPPVLGTTLAQWALYFPLGLVYSLHAKKVNLVLQRFKWGLFAAAIILFIMHLLHAYGVITTGWISFIAVIAFLMSTPLLKRNAIPRVRDLEKVGKRSYGLYLTHLIVIDLALLLFQWLLPGIFGVQVALLPLLFIIGLSIPMFVMERAARIKKTRKVYRYLFG